MSPRTVREFAAGPAGRIECALDRPEGAPRGVAVVCHPHPQFGGTLDNKVVQTIARAFVQLGWNSVRFNFRGIGESAGAWDAGVGEVEDALAVVDAERRRPGQESLPLVLAGFSFGGYVAAAAASRLASSSPVRRLVLVGPSTQKEQVPAAAADTVVIHGESDEVVPLQSTFDWARPLGLPVVVLPGVGHFFHGRLSLLKNTLLRELGDLAAV